MSVNMIIIRGDSEIDFFIRLLCILGNFDLRSLVINTDLLPT
jgi:hypothetical protein